ncbi:MAG: HlyD family efflux transporter periplasmic adaptor subunit [Clostridia bacterium]|nr:HlyD family efflux transporter periplasmic adaptor subunit [Clostridia bacterium]
MKRLTALMAAAMLMVTAVPALGETDLTNCSITNGTIRATEYVDITAPAAGTLLPFDVEAGDAVAEGDVLFTLMTTDVLAPEDGKITAMFAAAGEDAAAVTATYGMTASMEPARLMRVNCSIQGAFNEEDNKYLHVGETLYFESTKSGKEKGTGRVISVKGDNYVVEILEGEFEKGEQLTMYRSVNKGNSTNVGKGTVVRREPVAIQGTGLVTECFVRPGQQVKAGEKLFSVLPGCSDLSVKPEITAPEAAVVANVAAAAGQPVGKGQLLCRLYLTDELELVADVDEMDLKKLEVGSTVSFTLDTDSSTVLSGQVTEISSLGIQKQNAAYYTVHVRLYNAQGIRLGQSASLYLPND